MDNKKIAKFEVSFIGGNPKVFRYLNQNNSKSIDIFISKDGYCNKGKTCATIGMNEIETGLKQGKKKVRFELIALGKSNLFKLENILATTAFEIRDKKICQYGMVIPDVVRKYIKSTNMEHILLLSPTFWERYAPLEEEEEVVSWLLLVPISNDEAVYIQKHGVEQFKSLLEEKNVDISDYNRESIV